MYLSHNIVNQLIRIESFLQKIELTKEEEALTAINTEKFDKTLFYIINGLGINISLKDAAKLGLDKKVQTQDFRGDLVDNFRSAWKLGMSVAESDTIGITPNLLLQLNQTLARGSVEDWKLKYREAGEQFSLVYDDLLDIVPAENKGINTEEIVESIVNDFNAANNHNRLYKISLIAYHLLRLQPFMVFNKFSILLAIETLLERKLGSNYNTPIVAEFFTQQRPQIIRTFEITDLPAQEVSWHELFLNFLSEAFEYTTKNLNKKSQAKPANINKPFLDLNRRQLKVLKYLQTIPTVKREDYVQMMEVSAMTAYRDLQVLLNHKLIKAMGTGRGTKYMLYSR